MYLSVPVLALERINAGVAFPFTRSWRNVVLGIATCRENLSDFKVPRAVYFVEEFPTAELGKISKKDRREIADAHPPVD